MKYKYVEYPNGKVSHLIETNIREHTVHTWCGRAEFQRNISLVSRNKYKICPKCIKGKREDQIWRRNEKRREKGYYQKMSMQRITKYYKQIADALGMEVRRG